MLQVPAKAVSISVFGWPDPNTAFGQSEHALYTCYFINIFQVFIILTSIWQEALVGIGSVSDIKASNVTLCLLHTEQVRVDLN